MTAHRRTRQPIHLDRYPMAMSPGDLMSALNIKSRSYFCQLQREGRLKRFLLSRPVSKRYRYCRALVAQYLQEIREQAVR